MPARPLIAVTMGDPAGIGPELCLQWLSRRSGGGGWPQARFLVVGGAAVLQRVAHATGQRLDVPMIEAGDPSELQPDPPDAGAMLLDLENIEAGAVQPGQVSREAGRAAYEYLEFAVRAALAGRIAAVVTCPINKAAWAAEGIPYPGHTEALAEMTRTTSYAMMMHSDALVVSLATSHCALGQVISRLSSGRVFEVIELTHRTLQRLGVNAPLIGVCGLNPHAGEEGLFGKEEQRSIMPAIDEANAAGIRAEGPLPPDTAFVDHRRIRYHAYVCMYHDQGLIPVKMLAFRQAVNITMGLPIIRTSVDHGTAFDIAWQAKADASSLEAAVQLALRLAAGPRQLP